MRMRLDVIGRAMERERRHRAVVRPLEWEAAGNRGFRCVCCGHARREEQRREPQSEVCRLCVVAAGFLEN